MFQLDDQPQAPWWLDCKNGVRLLVTPPTSAMRMLARQAGREALTAAAEDPQAGYVSGDAIVHAFARLAIKGWDGVGDAKGKPVSPTPDLIAQLLNRSDGVFLAFNLDYVGPALEIETEKNASAPSRTGTSPRAAGPTARPAAKPASTARASSTPRKRTKGAPAGK